MDLFRSPARPANNKRTPRLTRGGVRDRQKGVLRIRRKEAGERLPGMEFRIAECAFRSFPLPF